MFRSEDIELLEITVSEDSAWEVLNTMATKQLCMMGGQPREVLHDKGCQNMLKACSETEDKINFILETAKIYNIQGLVTSNHPTKTIEQIQQDEEKIAQSRKADQIFDDIRQDVDQRYNSLKVLVENFEEQLTQMDNKKQELAIIKNVSDLFKRAGLQTATIQDGFEDADEEMATNNLSPSRFNYYAGLMNTEDTDKFLKTIFRVTRGTAFMYKMNVPMDAAAKNDLNSNFTRTNIFVDAKTKKPVNKDLVFLCIMSSQNSQNSVSNRIRALFDSHNVFRTAVDPGNTIELEKKKSRTEMELNELKTVAAESIKRIEEYVCSELSLDEATNVSRVERSLQNIHRQREIYKARLFLHPTTYETEMQGEKQAAKGNLLEGFVWVPKRARSAFTEAMLALSASKDDFIAPIIKEAEKPGWTKPTSFQESDQTMPFNLAVQTYSVPKYGEINPGQFTVASFPFLFGVMFGDFGHGLCMFSAGLVICCKANAWKKEGGMKKFVAELRYMILLMGFFAAYCGLIYNEFFSIAVPLAESCYKVGPNAQNEKEWQFKNMEGDVPHYGSCVYPFGMDWAWGASSNEVVFFNSYKMKMSVVLGIIHMSFGIILKGANAIYFKSGVDFIFEFIPQFVFFVGVFGYMVVLIIQKWTTNYYDWITYQGAAPAIKVPQIIATFSQIYTNPSATDKLPIIGAPEWNNEYINNHPTSVATSDTQYYIQLGLLGIAFVMVIMMMCFKPFILNAQNKKRKAQHGDQDEDNLQPLIDSQENLIDANKQPVTKSKKTDDHDAGHDEHDVPFGEQMIHQLIETIEFALGSISNTASYLRLWALSLAHSQLSQTFLQMTFQNYIKKPSSLGLGIPIAIGGSAGFVGVSFAILGCMDSMECFLHTLRLHWVEFNNKFFKGNGVKYAPLNFEERPEIGQA